MENLSSVGVIAATAEHRNAMDGSTFKGGNFKLSLSSAFFGTVEGNIDMHILHILAPLFQMYKVVHSMSRMYVCLMLCQ